MSLPGNGIFVVRGEMYTLITAMRRGSRWNSTAYVDEEKDALMKLFVDLKQVLNRITDLRLVDPNVFLAPFLEVIRTEATTGAITSLALSAINKFLSYGLIDSTSANLAVLIENIADAVTHARFMGTDQSSDSFTLLRMVEVLHTLMRSPEGSVLTNESVCEVILSCFKIYFETRLNELLRRSAEQALMDMVFLLFMRLPQFADDRSKPVLLKKLQMISASMEKDNKRRKKSVKTQVNENRDWKRTQSSNNFDGIKTGMEERQRKTSTHSQLGEDGHSLQTPVPISNFNVPPLVKTPSIPAGNIVDLQGKRTQTPMSVLTTAESGNAASDNVAVNANADLPAPATSVNSTVPVSNNTENEPDYQPKSPYSQSGSNEYINSIGVHFTDDSDEMAPLLPHGLPCIKEIFSFLILLCNPMDKQNTEAMIHMGLSLLTVAFEVGADNIGKYDTLLQLVKDDLCRNLFNLLNSECLTIFAADLQLIFLLFESLRGHLKFQLEFFLKKLSQIIVSDNPKTRYEMRELALDNLLQLWRIPGFVAELYINYDCDLYCSDLFESITNLLSKYTISATNAIYSTHVIAMDTLMSVVDSVESNCAAAKISNPHARADVTNTVNYTTSPAARHSRHNSGVEVIIIDDNNIDNNKVENISKYINSSTRLRLLSGCSAADKAITSEYLKEVKNKKRILSQGTDLFNQRPCRGIQFLQENGILQSQLDSMEVAYFMRKNPGLDKKKIGEYISEKKNVDSNILMNFVKSFDFVGLRVDQALRLYLETFRLPGEAPLIYLVLEHFADHWHKQNGEPFTGSDAALRLAYAIIILNVDQHNSNTKRLNAAMTEEGFLKNLRGLNGGTDFDQELLAAIFNAIKNEEIITPDEHTGLMRESYLWKVLLRRGDSSDGAFNYVHDSTYDMEIFNIIWSPLLSSLSFMFEKSTENGFQRILMGFTKCAGISAFYNLHEDFDALILTLCKFTTILSSDQQKAPNPVSKEIVEAVNFGLNLKAQAAMRTVFALVHDYGDSLRDGWRHILDIYLQLFRLKLLPKSLMEVEDFCEPSGKAQLIVEKPNQKEESGLFSSLYLYLSSEGQRKPSYKDIKIIKIAKKCIKDCQLDQMIQESKFVQLESLQELLKQVLGNLKAPNAHKSIGMPYSEDIVVFWMEVLVKIVIYNRDRMILLWPAVRDQMYLLLMASSSCGFDYMLHRCIVAMLKLGIYLMRSEELCPIVLQSLKMLLTLKHSVILRISKQISIGMYELLKTSAQNIHSEQDWQIVFTILECVGAGAELPEYEDASLPQPNAQTAKSDNALKSEEGSRVVDRGYISESDLGGKTLWPQKIEQCTEQQNSNSVRSFPPSPSAENLILANKDIDLTATSARPQSPPGSNGSAPALYQLIYNCKLVDHSPFALFKCCDSLAFIVRNVAYITPYNFESCVKCIRTFVEACRDAGIRQHRKVDADSAGGAQNQKKKSVKRRNDRSTDRNKNNSHESQGHLDNISDRVEEGDEAKLAQRYEALSIQLVDLMYTLYTRAAQIFCWWSEEGCAVPQCSALWAQGWCPLLQGIARLAMDIRKEVRTHAISCLEQRALLVYDLETLSGTEWVSCFQLVLFPLLNELMSDSMAVALFDSALLNESRIQTATTMSKVFLHRLTPLIELGNTFNELWIQILDYIEKFMKVGSDIMSEQIAELLKNMLLVMHTEAVFHTKDGLLNMVLWELTWQRIAEFLPNLKDELFTNEGNRAHVLNKCQHAASDDNNRLPTKGIVPQLLQPEMQQQSVQNSIKTQAIQSPLIISPIESPRHSIILQPPESDILPNPSFILVQVPTTTVAPIPMIVPQQQQQRQTSTHLDTCLDPFVISQTVEPKLPVIINSNSAMPQLSAAVGKSATSSTNVPTFVNNTPLSSTVTEKSASCNLYSIELFDSSPSISLVRDYMQQEWHDSPYIQPHNQHYQEQQTVTQYNKKSANESVTTSNEASSSSYCNNSIVGGGEFTTIAESAKDYATPATVLNTTTAANDSTNVLTSHLMGGKKHPSFHKRPPG